MKNGQQMPLYLEEIQQQLAESEDMLSKATMLADNAYISSVEGDVEECQMIIGQLIHSISEHFYEELH